MEKSIFGEPIELRLPSWAVCALEYGDYSGLTEEESAKIESFASDLGPGIFAWGDDTYFAWSNDIDNIGADCIDCTFLPHTAS